MITNKPEAQMLTTFLKELKSLEPSTKAQWGKMSAQHMIEHLILTFELSTGKFKADCVTPEEKLPLMKRFLMSNKLLPRLFINPLIGEDLLPLKYSKLEDSIEKLKDEIDYYKAYYKKFPDAKNTHVTFGDLNKTEWDKFHNKHLTHHLSQFGLI